MPAERAIKACYAERQDLTMRMSIRHFTRLTNAFSNAFQNHAHSAEPHCRHYNLVRIHKTLRVAAAMAAGVTDRRWTVDDIVGRLEAAEIDNTREARARQEVRVE